MQQPWVDLNADLGEGIGPDPVAADAALLDVVTTANVACGGHAGDGASMRETVRAAHARQVAITAHVSYPDRAGFGRTFLDLEPTALTDVLLEQAGALIGACRAEGSGLRVRAVKPHGALYNAIAHHEGHAHAVDLLTELSTTSSTRLSDTPGSEPFALVAAPGSRVAALARAVDIPVVLEAFADRGYRADGTLVPRSEPGALVTDPGHVVDRVVRMVREARVRAADGTVIRLDARSICLHGDTPGALELARAVRTGLKENGIAIRSAVA
jgi:UPF0271 protein